MTRSPFWPGVRVALWGYCTSRAYFHAAAGYEPALLVAGFTALLSIKALFQFLDRWDRRAERRISRKAARKPSKTHGSAVFGKRCDAKRAGMLKPGGPVLGRMQRRVLYTPRDCVNGLTIAPAGQGKGVGQAVPTLLTVGMPLTPSYETSMIVPDVSGELTAMTARHRARRMGQQIVVLNPFHETLAIEMGCMLGDSGFPALGFIEPGPAVKDDAALAASRLLPGQQRMSGSEEFFLHFARDILTLFILYLVARGVPSRVTLPELRRLIMLPPNAFKKLLNEMMLMHDFNGVIREYAGKLLSTLENAPEEFSGGLSTAQNALSIYDAHGPLGEHVGRGTFDFRDIRKRPTTVYIILPGDKLATHFAYLNLVISLAFDLIARDRSNKPVLFLLDELGNIGFLPSILRSMGLDRKNGYRIHGFVQSLGMLSRLYGRDGLRDFLAMSDVVNAYGVRDHDTLQMLSSLAGQRTVKEISQNMHPLGDRNPLNDLGMGAANRASSLIRPEDIRTMPDHKQLIFCKNAPPFYAEKLNYLKVRKWRRWAQPNPYYRKG